MTGKLEGKVAFVTGLARGQGRAHAVALAREGADIIGLDRAAPVDTMSYPMGSREELAETVRLVEAAGRRALVREIDVRDRAGIEALLADGVETLGRLDVVVANAAVSPPAHRIWEIPPEQWDDVIGINLTGVFHTLAAAVPHVLAGRQGGSIVVISSGAALNKVPNLGDYVTTKQGVIGLAGSLANEVAHRQIRVNVIAPGTVDTPMVTQNVAQFRLFRPDLPEPTLEDCRDAFTRMMPMGRPWLDPEDVSRAVVFLASDDARWITGVVLPVDQGNVNRPF
ncbi:MAG: putative oxidoreductase, short-chain alcohol dehydrogenase family [Frankiales bacterium]|nr:putative oxidoreductase, short-chain alcohol dehydrogenase family [Frankiales bacterium]